MSEEPSSPAPVAQLEMAAICSNISTRSEVLENVNWSVAPGDYWVIGGLPGSGKSDLLSTLGGLSRLARGTLRLFGNEVRQMAEEELVQIRKRIGFVFAYGGRLFNHLTVAENLALPLCYHENCIPSGAEDRVHWTLAALELTPLAHSTPGTISRHLRQRVGLARALVLNPELLLLDNPVAGMDPVETRWWFDFLKGLSTGHALIEGRKMTLVVTTDDLRLWTRQARQVALIKDKTLIPFPDPNTLRQFEHPLVRELKGGADAAA